MALSAGASSDTLSTKSNVETTAIHNDQTQSADVGASVVDCKEEVNAHDNSEGLRKPMVESEDGEVDEEASKKNDSAPPLPNEAAPPLPSEPPPTQAPGVDDGWQPLWEESSQAFYFYNRFTGASQWTNPRVPEATAPGVEVPKAPAARPAGGYDPAVHGDYDPNAWYAQPAESDTTSLPNGTPQDPVAAYGATAAFNRFTGRFQNADLAPENFNDENKSKRQMNAFFDVDAAANSHDGRSLKEERSGKKVTKNELKKFKEKRKAKKEEKRKAWLRD